MTWIRERPEGLVYRDPQKSYDGLTLFCSVMGKHATLLNPEGLVVHQWHMSEGIQHAHMLDNGHLLIQTTPYRYAGGRQNMGGNAGALMELDWNSKVVWAYRNPAQHHAYERLANGNHIVLAWYPVPAEIRKQVMGGIPIDNHEGHGSVMWGDVVLEINRSGRVLKRWNSWEFLDTQQDIICPLEKRKEWGHANSLCTTPSGDWLISFRGTSQVVIVDADSGQIKWRLGKEEDGFTVPLSHQHAATWLDNGNILIFDNGCHRPGAPAYSRVIEFNPNSRKVEWQYQSDVLLGFFSYMCSGASRLPNGNTLITESQTGRIFEVTKEGETVWEFVSPFHFPSRFGRSPFVFRAYRYALNDPRFSIPETNPDHYRQLNSLIKDGNVPENFHAS